LEDDNPIFRRPYRFSEVERVLVQAQITKLLNAGLVELFKGEYASVIVMLTTLMTSLFLAQLQEIICTICKRCFENLKT
jgi:hypothetical protein